MWRLLCYRWSYKAYSNFFCRVFLLGPDHFLLAAVQTEARQKQLCPGHVRQVQGVPPPQSGWLTSLCGHLLEKDQEGLSAPARQNLWLGSPLRASANGLLRISLCCHSKWGDYDPILPERPESFFLGLVGSPRPGTRLLGRGRWENRQCRGKGNTLVNLQHPQYGLKLPSRE